MHCEISYKFTSVFQRKCAKPWWDTLDGWKQSWESILVSQPPVSGWKEKSNKPLPACWNLINISYISHLQSIKWPLWTVRLLTASVKYIKCCAIHGQLGWTTLHHRTAMAGEFDPASRLPWHFFLTDARFASIRNGAIPAGETSFLVTARKLETRHGIRTFFFSPTTIDICYIFSWKLNGQIVYKSQPRVVYCFGSQLKN